MDGILAALRDQGLRITRSRRSIVLVLFNASGPLALAEIQQEVRAEGGVLPDYATVFRMMLLLERMRLVHKVNLKRSCSYYELTHPSKHYDHVVCIDCGKVELLDSPCPVEETERRIERELGFSGLHHSLEFFGRCPVCSAIPGAPVAAGGVLQVQA